ncbi:NCS2 family permease [Clostridium sp. FP1]|uniref:NCS2 family permease n=1 Tax=Clostridium sp. FP1 TaxID=2724076 RepID=UPI0013E90598|nr:NCS2 family permease [Clostridium sp. FP1]MBZ9634887.1 NCS2 family permease [Clostridium sp. FP1]
MEKIFKLKKNNTNFKTEFTAALTSFFASVYIIVVNASILSDTGMPMDAQIIATVLASLVGCLLVAFISNTPLIIMPGMGVNALFTYTIVRAMGLNYHEALASVLIAGFLFSVVALTQLSEILSTSIPNSLKEAITVGIGLFITFIGLQKGGLIVSSSTTLVQLGKLTDPHVLAFLITMIITLCLFLKDIPGAFLISIFLGTITSIAFGIVDLGAIKFGLPNFSAYNDLFFTMNFGKIGTIPFWVATFSLTLVLVFENIGLLHGQVGGMLKQPEKINKALRATAFSTVFCGLLGTSPSVSTVEGAAGIAAGGKTGLTSFLTGLLFLISLFFIPIITIIPNAAISPILIIIGGLMIKNIINIDFEDFSESFPAFLIITLIPLTYSIVDGIAFGFIVYPLAKIFAKKHKEVSLTMYLVSLIFLIYFVLRGLSL